jgi:hypothetical protein
VEEMKDSNLNNKRDEAFEEISNSYNAASEFPFIDWRHVILVCFFLFLVLFLSFIPSLVPLNFPEF